MTENWKPVPGYEGRYDVSDLGRLRTYRGRGKQVLAEPRVMKNPTRRNGYVAVALQCDGRIDNRYVHRLVMLAFVGPDDGREVNHINAVRGDNRLANLEYATRAENVAHAVAHGLVPRGERCAGAKITEEIVREIRRRVASGERQKDVGVDLGVPFRRVSRIVTGSAWAWVN